MNKKQLKHHGINEDADSIECPDCLEWSTVKDWDSDVFSWGECEESICMECPKCKETFDTPCTFNYK